MSAEERPPAPAANDEQSALASLKALLIGPEQTSIEELVREAHDPELQSQRVAVSLPDSLHQAYADAPEELARSLESPVSACIEDSVRRNPGFFADILFPIMGPAIRRSISQALKGLVQHINQTLEHSLTLKGLKWRLEAARTGVPFAEVVLRHTLRYRVEEAFLIQGGSGLMIQHVSQGPTPDTDADAVSAMLTAIRDFTQDTMNSDGDDSRLETVDVGDHTLWLVHGPCAYIACAIRGMPPISLRDDFSAVVEEIHQRHARLLETFDGDPSTAAPVIPLLERCLLSEMEEQPRKRFPWPMAIVFAALVGAAGWWLVGIWQDGVHDREHLAHLDRALDQLRAAPGLIVTEHRVDDGQLRLQGLHDPLTRSPNNVLASAGLTADDYTLTFRAFESADPEAALARARQRLAPPSDVELTLDDRGILSATGVAGDDWMQRAELLATTVPGINMFDASGLENSDRRLLRQLRKALQPPPQVAITVDDGQARVSGKAPVAWIRALRDAPPALPGLLGFDASALHPLEKDRLDELGTQIDTARIKFTQGIELDETQQSEIAALAALIGEAHQHATDLGLPLRLLVIGRTDGAGSVERNQFVAMQRAGIVADTLRASDHAMPAIELRSVIQPAPFSDVDAALRRVEFHLERTAGDSGGGVGAP